MNVEQSEYLTTMRAERAAYYAAHPEIFVWSDFFLALFTLACYFFIPIILIMVPFLYIHGLIYNVDNFKNKTLKDHFKEFFFWFFLLIGIQYGFHVIKSLFRGNDD